MKHRKLAEILKALDRAQKDGNFKIIGNKYSKRSDKTTCKCNKCGREWETNFGSILSGFGCKKCKDDEHFEKLRIRKETEFYAKTKDLNLTYSFYGKYKNRNSVFQCTCKDCGHEFKRSAELILKGCECPKCRFERVGKERRKTHEEFLEDLSKLTDEIIVESEYKTNHDKVVCKCKHCGFTWKAKPNMLLLGKGLNCKKCSTSDSVPNRFMLNCLTNSSIKFEQEKVFTWSDKRRYDFYIPDLKMIIEMHGGQHYIEGFSSLKNAKSLKEVQENDEYKMQLALSNGIEKYVVIDSRDSSKKWLTEHVLNSEIGYLFKEVNFDNVFKNCYISSTAKFAELYNSGITDIHELMDMLKISRNSVYRLKSKAKDANLLKAS